MLSMLRTKNVDTRPPARTPENVTIKPQRMGFEFGEKVPNYWLDNSYILSHTMNALSVLFPQGEQFFVDSVRYYRDQITDPKLKDEVRGFIGQEAMHSLEHIAMNQHVRDRGMPVDELEKHLEVVLGVARKLPKRHQLAITCGLEHMTAMMADMLLKDPAGFSLKDAAKGLWRMWGWNGTFSSLAPTWLEYFKPNFHPWDHDNSELIARFKEQINDHIAPQYQAGNRRTLQ